MSETRPRSHGMSFARRCARQARALVMMVLLAPPFVGLSAETASSTALEALPHPAVADRIELRNDRAIAVVAPALAGRVVEYRRVDGDNVLLFTPDPDEGPGGYRSYNGHVVWLGPQDGWWADQHEFPERRDARAHWPPNEQWETARYRVIERDAARVVLTGPSRDPVAGWTLTKTVALRPDGSLDLDVAALNADVRPRTWSIWSNTRLAGVRPAFAPVAWGTRVALHHRVFSDGEGLLPAIVAEGWFNFDIAAPLPRGSRRLDGKMLASPRAPALAAFVGRDGDTVFWKTSPDLARDDERAPGHGPVEIYQCLTDDPAAPDAVTELEFHSPHRTLAPGGRLVFRERWQLLSYDGPPTREARIRFLERTLATANAGINADDD